jgi:hypothetical protein
MRRRSLKPQKIADLRQHDRPAHVPHHLFLTTVLQDLTIEPQIRDEPGVLFTLLAQLADFRLRESRALR